MEAPICLKTGQSTITETFTYDGKIYAKILCSIKHDLSGYGDNSVKDSNFVPENVF